MIVSDEQGLEEFRDAVASIEHKWIYGKGFYDSYDEVIEEMKDLIPWAVKELNVFEEDCLAIIYEGTEEGPCGFE